jgi:murein L,D-transpeptidase YafK
MKFSITSALILFISIACFSQTFKQTQLQNPRVKTAYTNKEAAIKKLLTDKKIDINSLQLFIRAFKKEHKMEIWAKDARHPTYTLLKTYDICYFSGGLGPKRKEGDLQVPEGFYNVAGYNPNGTYHLTLWVDYPNASDRVLSDKTTPGGDICIHGKCVSIGCMPMTDPMIEEIYILCTEAHTRGQAKIPAHIFPAKMDTEGYKALQEEYKDNPTLLAFWENLKPGYDFFESRKTIPHISVDVTGKYMLSKYQN